MEIDQITVLVMQYTSSQQQENRNYLDVEHDSPLWEEKTHGVLQTEASDCHSSRSPKNSLQEPMHQLQQ